MLVKLRRDILSALLIRSWSNNNFGFAWETRRGFPKSLLRVFNAVAQNRPLFPIASITLLAYPSWTLRNLSILRLSSKVVLKCTLERKFSINSAQSTGFPLNRRNLTGGKIHSFTVSYFCFKENCKLIKEVVLRTFLDLQLGRHKMHLKIQFYF